jgi:hypothetical protein
MHLMVDGVEVMVSDIPYAAVTAHDQGCAVQGQLSASNE